jgi:uroporphyrin-III C-methyltransferase / precorrin-2 dehydrogenase / sirohydrochlorin ferrochelatase
MEHFPAFMNLRGRKAVVIGGGAVAGRKADMLARAGARVTIIAPRICASLSDDIKAETYTHLAEPFADNHLTGAMLVIAATDSHDVNRQVARHGRLRGIPVNVVDDPELSSFIMPAIVDRSPVTVAISTGGASPVLARWIKTRIETALPSTLGRAATLAGIMRRVVAMRVPDITTRRRFWERWIEEEDATAVSIYRALNRGDREDGQVWLVGAGPGDPDLLTIKALRALQSADVIVHDRLVSDEILDLARRDADRFPVDMQYETNELLIAHARAGKRVIRLTYGDSQPIKALIDAGILCHLVPGITVAARQPMEFIKSEKAA